MMRHLRGPARAALVTVTALAAVLVGSSGQAASGPAASAEAATTQAATDDLPGGKTVVGQTSPIHDPALIVDGDTWYVYSTGLVNRENGGTIQMWSSTDDGTTWGYTGTVWDTIPAWIDEQLTAVDNLWAPEIYEHDGTFYLYYSASSFGTNNSITALATNTTLDPDDPDYAWVDQGAVVASPVVGLPNGATFNAIDAGIVEGADGTPYMAIGSFWYGIWLVELDWPSGKPVENWQASAVNIADRFMAGNPIEAPYITEHDGYYYLFVSFDRCCSGADSTYKVAVGRATDVTGPYLDMEGDNLFGGGGSVVFDAHGAIVGPGGQSVFGDYMAFHYYDASNAAIPYFPTLGLQKIAWVDGWPTFDQTVELPTITTQPADVTARLGADVELTVTGTGTPAPVAVWETSVDDGATWTTVEGAQPVTDTDGTSRLAVDAVTAADDGHQWRAVLHNAHGTATSDPATVTLDASLVITGQPASVTVAPRGTTTLEAVASGSPAPTVRWESSTNSGRSWSRVAAKTVTTSVDEATGTTTTSLSLTAARCAAGASYRAVFTGADGASVTTDVATVTVAKQSHAHPAPHPRSGTTNPR